jgi:diguanylate cyclase (GGDEF)-like protein
MISQGEKLDDILELIVEKARRLADSEVSFLLFREESRKAFYIKTADGGGNEALSQVTLTPNEDVFKGVFAVNRPLLIDSVDNSAGTLREVLREKFRVTNMAGLPVFLHGRVAAFLVIGTSKDRFTYGKDDLEMLSVFAKQVAVAIENDILAARVEQMEMKDPLTGLLSDSYTRHRLEEEIRRVASYHSMCAFVLFDIDSFKNFHLKHGLLAAEAALKKIAFIIRDSVSEVGYSGRTGDDEFVVLLPEKNKRQAHDIAEAVRRKIESAGIAADLPEGRLTVSGGVSENPLDGVTADQLVAHAREMAGVAKQQGRNRIVSFKEPRVCR